MADNEKTAEGTVKAAPSAGILGLLSTIFAAAAVWGAVAFMKECTRQQAIDKPAEIKTVYVDRVRTEYKDRVVIKEKIVEIEGTIPIVPVAPSPETSKTIALSMSAGWRAYEVGAEYYLTDWISAGPRYICADGEHFATLGFTLHF